MRPFARPAFLTILTCLFLWTGCGTPRPAGVADAGADALARKMLASVGDGAWKRTGAITWTFADRNNYLWDRRRQLARVKNGDEEVYLRLGPRTGVAFADGERLDGKKADKAIEKAYKAWANDSFWFIANNKAFDPGSTRYRVPEEDGGEALFVEYSSGGATPGDAYLWHLDENGRPVSWQMWVSVFPIGGMSGTWEDWVKLPTGLWVATRHEVGPLTIKVTDLDAAETTAQLVSGPDPFRVLLGE